MNIKQIAKFIILSIVFSFLLAVVLGILEAFFKDIKISSSILDFFYNILGLLIVIPAIATAAKMTYRKTPVAKEQISKIAVINTIITLITSCLVFFSPGGVKTQTIIFIVIDLFLTYFMTTFFIKKYSVTTTVTS